VLRDAAVVAAAEDAVVNGYAEALYDDACDDDGAVAMVVAVGEAEASFPAKELLQPVI